MKYQDKFQVILEAIILTIFIILVSQFANCKVENTTVYPAVNLNIDFKFISSEGDTIAFNFMDTVQSDSTHNYNATRVMEHKIKVDTVTKIIAINPEDTLALTNKLFLYHNNGKVDSIEKNELLYFAGTMYELIHTWGVDIPVDSFEVTVYADTVHDTTYVKPDTVYLPTFYKGDRVHIEFDFKDDEPIRISCNFAGKQDTVQKYGMFSTYQPGDSLRHYSRDWQYYINLGVGQTIDTTIVNDVEVYRRWQVVDLSIQGHDYWGNAGIPSPPFKHVYVEEISGE